MVNLKAELADGKVPLGAAIITPSIDVVEILSYHFDWLMVDFEHSAIDLGDLPNIARTAERWDTAMAVRVAETDPGQINRILDAGADGIIHPHVTSAEDAQEAVEATFYPPLGKRSVGYARAQQYGADRFETVQSGNDSILCMGLIEDMAGVENANEICAVEGMDALMVGPNDLAAAKGSFDDASSDEDIYDVDEDIERVADAAADNDVYFGYPAANPDDVEEVLEVGSQLVLTIFASAMLNEAARERADGVRSLLDDGELI